MIADEHVMDDLIFNLCQLLLVMLFVCDDIANEAI